MTEVTRRAGRAARPAFALLLALAGCGRPEARVEGTGGGAAADASSAVPVQPYRSPPGFPLPFRTVVPEVFSAGAELEDGGGDVRFAWREEEVNGDSAFLYLRVLPEGTPEGRAREIVRTAAERLRVPGDRSELQPLERHPWAVAEYPLRSAGTAGEPIQGWVALGSSRGRWFYVIAQAPAAVWPRFEPQAERILSGWRWADRDSPAGGAALGERP